MDAMSRNVSDFVEFFKLSGRSSEGRLERVKGIEPSYSAWEAAALPLSYTRIIDWTSSPAAHDRTAAGKASRLP